MRAVTGKPIKLIGVGEKLDALEEFYPDRIAGRILGMGDVVGLVEKAIETVELDKAEAIAKKVKKGAFDLDDLAEQLKQMQKIGGMGGVLCMLPGLGKVKKQLDAANLDDRILKRQQAIIGSMTNAERKNPKLLNASRKKRVAAGSGTSRAGHQQAGEDAPPDGRHDEGHGQEARHAWARCSAAAACPRCPPTCRARTDLPPISQACRPAASPEDFPACPAVLPRGLPGLPRTRNVEPLFEIERLGERKPCH